jgi:Uma2 family endonuclease
VARAKIAVMGDPAEKPRRATYADVLAVPENKVAEIIDGELHVFPRPAPPHAFTSSELGAELNPFRRGRSGPGGWHIIDEPEIHFHREEPVVPDLAGWRIERMPKLPSTAYFTLPPDWACEVLSKRTEKIDRTKKMPLYAHFGVPYLWLVHPIRRTLEVFALNEVKRWEMLATHEGKERVRAAPFADIELDLSLLWAEVEGEEQDE